ncbi:hypothetical protein B0H17DRAFT_1127692 [Mycena rosella]|uniref:Uncharacterized protein n=1 Tax=Mycena rosella TaxID=1033263 RepID=A0AAD7GRB8_MYCRO|nr:hypothetical protein B0H17DRAFT_1127692 [Mycena rosella]
MQFHILSALSLILTALALGAQAPAILMDVAARSPQTSPCNPMPIENKPPMRSRTGATLAFLALTRPEEVRFGFAEGGCQRVALQAFWGARSRLRSVEASAGSGSGRASGTQRDARQGWVLGVLCAWRRDDPI